MPDQTSHPTIARIWRGRTRRRVADEYEAYNYEVGIKPLIEKAMGVQMLREDRADETEFITTSYWESVEAMSRFTGGDPTRIHHLDRDPEFLIELPSGVQILRVLALTVTPAETGSKRVSASFHRSFSLARASGPDVPQL